MAQWSLLASWVMGKSRDPSGPRFERAISTRWKVATETHRRITCPAPPPLRRARVLRRHDMTTDRTRHITRRGAACRRDHQADTAVLRHSLVPTTRATASRPPLSLSQGMVAQHHPEGNGDPKTRLAHIKGTGLQATARLHSSTPPTSKGSLPPGTRILANLMATDGQRHAPCWSGGWQGLDSQWREGDGGSSDKMGAWSG